MSKSTPIYKILNRLDNEKIDKPDKIGMSLFDIIVKHSDGPPPKKMLRKQIKVINKLLQQL